jgi:hypothetical protein
VTAQVSVEKDKLSPLIDFNINFIDRQMLKRLEDSIIDLHVILPTLLGNITGVRELCRRDCEEHHLLLYGRAKYDCAQIIAEIDEHIQETEYHFKRAEALKEKCKSTAQLVCLLFSL